MTNQLRLAFYGDDFTGSTDAMDALSKAGVDTVLFLETVDPETVEREFPNVDAVGVAGTSRTMNPMEMEAALPEAFEALGSLDTPLIHYKICSTFDSSPDTGSIGRAIDIGARVFDTETVPILPGAPPLGRYVVFGNMFASDGESVYRLDRHPTMSQHPITPMQEGNLLKHLSEQTDKRSHLINVPTLNQSDHELQKTFRERVRDGKELLFFDTLTDEHLRRAGWLIWKHTQRDQRTPTFLVGSSGLEYALTRHWADQEMIEGNRSFPTLEPVDATLVMSGSASPLTDTQIQAALDAGFRDVRIRTDQLVGPDGERERARVVGEIVERIRAGDSVVAFTARGPDDTAIGQTKDALSTLDDPPANAAAVIGESQGAIMQEALSSVEVDRVCVAGGDTCGFVVPYLDIYALQVMYPLNPGSPLCIASSDVPRFDGMEIALKGGQLGHEEYFVDLQQGASQHC